MIITKNKIVRMNTVDVIEREYKLQYATDSSPVSLVIVPPPTYEVQGTSKGMLYRSKRHKHTPHSQHTQAHPQSNVYLS